MQEALLDFRIESDAMVWLSFANGTTYRVSPDDLEHYLRREDLLRIRQAIGLRSQFMRRVLPPTIIMLLAAGIIGLGGHDMQRVEALSHPKATAPKATVTTHRVPTQLVPSKSSPAAAPKATTTPVASLNSNSQRTTPMSSAEPASVGGGSGKVTASATKDSAGTPAAAPVLTPVTQTVQSVAAPVAQVIHPVTQVVTPVTDAPNRLLGGL